MPSVGKSTVGLSLARALTFSHLDSDYIIEALYGVELQKVADKLTKEDFLDLECEVIKSLYAKRTVISTGGSVVYREEAMLFLKNLGPCVFLSAPLELILKRIALNPDRGLAINPGQTVEDLYNERMELYKKYADYTIEINSRTSIEAVTKAIVACLV